MSVLVEEPVVHRDRRGAVLEPLVPDALPGQRNVHVAGVGVYRTGSPHVDLAPPERREMQSRHSREILSAMRTSR